jgi:hypothetical protein
MGSAVGRFITLEASYQIDAATQLAPDALFERRWALTLLEQTMATLRAEFELAGKADEFEILKGFLTAEKGAMPYAQAATRAGMSEGALRVAVHRLRRRFREVFRQEIVHTVVGPDDIEAEVRHLLSVLSR